MSVAAKYERTDPFENESKQTSARVAAARNYIKQIKSVAILSPEWITLANNMEQLGRLSQMESHLPNEKVTSGQEGRTEGEGTLWDQSAHEETIRVLVEEAKVNLCIRLMNEFKRWDYKPDLREETINKSIERYKADEAMLERNAQCFEDNLGILLVRAFAHVETLQLCDIPLIFEHILMVLKHVEENAESKSFSPKSQEKVAIYYYAYILKYTEQLNTAEIFGRLKELDLIHEANRYLAANFVPLETLVEVMIGYAALCDDEDFLSDWKSFFPTQEHKQSFLELDKLAQKMLAHYEEKIREIRPLLDFLKKLERTNL